MKQRVGRRRGLLKELAGSNSFRRPVYWQESECKQDTRILTLPFFSSSGRWSRQYVCCWKMSAPRALPVIVLTPFQLQAACLALGRSKWDQNCSSWEPNLLLFTVSHTVFFPSSTPQYFLSESIQFRSLLTCIVWDNGTSLTFYAAFLPNTMTRNNIFKQTLLFSILHNYVDFTFSAPMESVSTFFSLALFAFWLNHLKPFYFSFLTYTQ